MISLVIENMILVNNLEINCLPIVILTIAFFKKK